MYLCKWSVFIWRCSSLDDHSKHFTVQFIAIHPFTHSHTHSHSASMGSPFLMKGLSILPTDTSARRWGRLGSNHRLETTTEYSNRYTHSLKGSNKRNLSDTEATTRHPTCLTHSDTFIHRPGCRLFRINMIEFINKWWSLLSSGFSIWTNQYVPFILHPLAPPCTWWNRMGPLSGFTVHTAHWGSGSSCSSHV